MSTSRMAAFSDGVVAIIITIMVLELPRPEGVEWSDLIHGWHGFAAYAVSFVYVGIYWNNHHHLLHAVKRVNGTVLWANLYLLFWLSLFPFVASWLGENVAAPVPVTCYAVVALMAGTAYWMLTVALVRADADSKILAEATGAGVKELVSMALYAVAVVAPFAGSAGVVLGEIILVAVAGGWLVPDRRIERRIRAA